MRIGDGGGVDAAELTGPELPWPELSDTDQAMLSGEHGKAAQVAMRIVVRPPLLFLRPFPQQPVRPRPACVQARGCSGVCRRPPVQKAKGKRPLADPAGRCHGLWCAQARVARVQGAPALLDVTQVLLHPPPARLGHTAGSSAAAAAALLPRCRDDCCARSSSC